MKNTRTYLLAATALAAIVTLSACSGGLGGMDMGTSTSMATPSASADAAGTFNDADVMFAQMMVPHHEQAVEMSDMLLAKDGIDQEVTDLATEIKEAQQPEIDQLNEWLTQWGSEPAMSGMSHGDGMMSADDMAALEAASGTEASKLFLEQMISHHQGAIAMAQDEVDNGENADAQKMAATIVSTQTDEISRMQDLLGSL
ncbi:hypothetical protein ASF62_11980 [Leifsonia sp. Leaf325]|nr:DUF305 domain-containing protein [Leifsonia sp. Leaf325]KQQ92565.1 hypothetical protein ASF62_11980 [Leifsonia sp. Leaf325]